MDDIRFVTDLDECRILWERYVPRETVTDLWEVRECFQRHYQRPACFVLLTTTHDAAGLLPLSLIEESQCYGYFPGETWKARTWLEQNRLLVTDDAMLETLMAPLRAPIDLRYLVPAPGDAQRRLVVDEIDYTFHPPHYDYEMENYFREFSGKSRRQLRNELVELEQQGVVHRHEILDDLETLFEMNRARFGFASYFSDERFCASFRSLLRLFHDRNWLRLTSVLIGGQLAAVDMGCVYGDTCTVLCGGTDVRFPGVAKLINLHHMRRACEERISTVDFLSGDFTWKKLFHLTPRPLYQVRSRPAPHSHAMPGRTSAG